MESKKSILIIDDEENMRHVLQALLEKEGYTTALAADGQAGLELLEQKHFDLVLCDVRMPRMDGIEFLKHVCARNITATIITMSAYGTIDLAVETMQLGAYDYISKPFKPPEILLALKKAEERERLKEENVRLRSAVELQYSFGNLIGTSPAIQEIFTMIKKVAGFKSSVLITGESGTGKELVARAIHYNSPRKNSTFLAINCGAIPESLLESELFGHKKGSFTGATQDRKGIFEEADEGTLFLDEIGDIPLNLQVKLLRALQEGEIRRVGEERPLAVDVRVIAATGKNLEKEVAGHTFREDLFYRLNVLPVHLPPLRERRDDIELLARHFIKKYNISHNLAINGLRSAALQKLLQYSWPGNIRELENIIERAMILAEHDMLDIDTLPENIVAPVENACDDLPQNTYSIRQACKSIEAQLIRKALQKTHGNKSRAAKLLEISYPALLTKISEYRIVYEEERQ
ncbi:MAG: sigma-54-dependent Fis family transcriptional regulator [Deltaproteobacteria bacterium]|nr:sigma-54-dependent Fis family transcriptional regulator [Deltaproteobacteria bacterium]